MGYRLFGQWKLYRRALGIALPVMAQLFIQTLVSLIDNFMVAGLGDIKLAGVNVANQINFIYFIIIGVICTSGGIFMSQFFGAKDKNGMQNTFRFKLILGSLLGISYTILMLYSPEKMFAMMLKNNKDATLIIEQAMIYSKTVAISWIFTSIATVIASSLREIELVFPPLIISIIATLINTFFNWMLIYGNLGMPKLEVAGAAYATDIARFCEVVIFIIYILIKKPPFVIKIWTIFKIKLTLFVTIIKKSTLVLYADLLWAICELTSNALYNTRGGAEVVSGISSGLNIAHLFFLAFAGITVATSVIIGQELGSGNLEKAKELKRYLLSGSVVFGLFFVGIGCLSNFLVLLIYHNLSLQAQVIARQIIIIAAIYMPLWVYLNCQYAISRAGGDMIMGAICDTVSNIIFVGSLFLLIYFTTLPPAMLYGIVKLSDIVKTLIAHFWLKKERWIVNLTLQNKK